MSFSSAGLRQQKKAAEGQKPHGRTININVPQHSLIIGLPVTGPCHHLEFTIFFSSLTRVLKELLQKSNKSGTKVVWQQRGKQSWTSQREDVVCQQPMLSWEELCVQLFQGLPLGYEELNHPTQYFLHGLYFNFLKYVLEMGPRCKIWACIWTSSNIRMSEFRISVHYRDWASHKVQVRVRSVVWSKPVFITHTYAILHSTASFWSAVSLHSTPFY